MERNGKIASLAYARIQGKSALITHFQNSSLKNEDKPYRPILFHSEGPEAGDLKPFPMGVNPRVRPNDGSNSRDHPESPTGHGNKGDLVHANLESTPDGAPNFPAEDETFQREERMEW